MLACCQEPLQAKTADEPERAKIIKQNALLATKATTQNLMASSFCYDWCDQYTVEYACDDFMMEWSCGNCTFCKSNRPPRAPPSPPSTPGCGSYCHTYVRHASPSQPPCKPPRLACSLFVSQCARPPHLVICHLTLEPPPATGERLQVHHVPLLRLSRLSDSSIASTPHAARMPELVHAVHAGEAVHNA